MKAVLLLEPGDVDFLPKPVANALAPTEFDFIEHYYKHKNLTHAWNEFNLRPEVIERLTSPKWN